MTPEERRKLTAEIMAEFQTLDLEDRSFLMDLIRAYVARSRGMATPEQLALIENAKREFVDLKGM